MEEIYLVLLGLIWGSFLNVVIYRLPLEKSVVKPASYCPSCKATIKFYDNIPVISYILLWGKCRYCRSRIPVQYPLVEAFTAFSFWAAYQFSGGITVYMAAVILFLCLIIALGIIDLKHMILPDELTLGGAAIFLIYSFFHPEQNTLELILTAFAGSLFFAAIYYYYVKIRKREGLGFGDVKLMLLLGAFLGFKKLLVAILIASFAGVLVGLYFILFKKKTVKLALPFGTFLSLGSYISLFYGHTILDFLRGLYL
jgi:leader peptidase (prepilin peptidase)/N-methyltransferase